jgi:16S rRNA processing protein RimM
MSGIRSLILVGRIGAAQGVRGEVRIKSFTGDPKAIASYGPLTDADGRRAFRLSKVRVLRDDMLVATLEGIGDRDAAAVLTGTDLYVRRENLPTPDDDEVYVADLIGLSAFDEAGLAIGTVVDVQNFGAGDILEVAPVAGGETLLVPFTKASVPDIDLKARRIVVVVPREDDASHDPDDDEAST